MAKRTRPEEEVLDDIELLNAHRYPESMAPALVAHVRASKACQQRLQELLRSVPHRRGRVAMDAGPADAESEAGSPTAAGESLWKRMRRYLLG